MVDVDGVVVHAPDGRRWDADLEADLGIAPAALQDLLFRGHFKAVSLGRADLLEVLAAVLPPIAPHVTPKAFIDYWFEKDSRLDHVLLEDLAVLRAKGLQMHLATVQEHHRARYLWETLGLKDRFDAMHYAAALGCAKPSPEFWAAVQDRTGFAPADLLLIDDSPLNIEGARKAGWRAELWDGTRRLAQVLAG